MKANNRKHTLAELACIDCGAPVNEPVGGVSICEDCLDKRGSCCPEFGAFDLTEDSLSCEYASPPCSAHLFDNKNDVEHHVEKCCFCTSSGAKLDYYLNGCVIFIIRTFAPEHLRGKGLAADLMDAAVRYAKKEGLTLDASCSYAKTYLQKRDP